MEHFFADNFSLTGAITAGISHDWFRDDVSKRTVNYTTFVFPGSVIRLNYYW